MFSAEQERRKLHVREAWQDSHEPSKPRSLWNQQPQIDSAILNRYTPMNDSTGRSPHISKEENAIKLSIDHSFQCSQFAH